MTLDALYLKMKERGVLWKSFFYPLISRFSTYSSQPNEKGRIYFLDLTKVLCTFLVVYAHLFSGDSYTRLYIYAFHMPLFFIICGIFHRERKLSVDTLIIYFKRLFIPALFFIILYILIYGIILGIYKGDIFCEIKLLVKETIKGALNSGSMSNVPCWFLIALFFSKFFMDILLKIPIKLQLVLAIILAVSVVYFRYPLYIRQSFLALPFCFVGYYVGDFVKNLNTLGSKNYFLLFVLLTLINCSITYYNGRVSMTSVLFGIHSHYIGIPLFYINGIVGSFALIFFSLCLSKRESKMVQRLAPSMITILGFQWFMIVPYAEMTKYQYNSIIPFIYSIFTISCCYLVFLFVKRIAPILIGEKREIDK